jgi:hypothetical protein
MGKHPYKIEVLKKERDVFIKFLDGESRKEIMEYLKHLGMSYNGAKDLYYRVKKQFEEVRNDLAIKIINIHVDRYEDIYQKCMAWGLEMLAMSSLYKKEQLLGFAKEEEGFSVEINNNMLKIEQGHHSFDEYLNKEEEERLLLLLEKIGHGLEPRQIGD